MGPSSISDADKDHLPDGMVRVGYDANTHIYTYRDAEGSIWESEPGDQYGEMHRADEEEEDSPDLLWAAATAAGIDGSDGEEHPLPAPQEQYNHLYLPGPSDAGRAGDGKRTRTRYRPRVDAEARSPPQRRKSSSFHGIMRLLRRAAGSSKPRREGPRLPPDLQRRRDSF